jgi:hypothetical protein
MADAQIRGDGWRRHHRGHRDRHEGVHCPAANGANAFGHVLIAMLFSQDADVYFVIPAKAGIHERFRRPWIPAFAGMTMVALVTEQHGS